jgi:hypothetical protein
MTIKVERTHDCTATVVSGNQTEMAVFWAIWQDAIWIGWMRDIKHPHAASHREAIRQIRDTGKLMLADNSRMLGDAVVLAIAKCKELGIDVE